MIFINVFIVLLKDIFYVDFFEFKFNEYESIEMLFCYVKIEDGKFIMFEVSGFLKVYWIIC